MRQPEQRSSVKSGCLLRGLAAIGHDAGALAIAAASAKITRSAAIEPVLRRVWEEVTACGGG
jgi:hypothetical protein